MRRNVIRKEVTCRICRQATKVIAESKITQSMPREFYCKTCKANPQFRTIKHYIRKFDMELPQILTMLANISVCECCGVTLDDNNPFQIDHCHTTGNLRGVLCWNCNSGIGKLGDTYESVLRAVEYLKKYQSD